MRATTICTFSSILSLFSRRVRMAVVYGAVKTGLKSTAQIAWKKCTCMQKCTSKNIIKIQPFDRMTLEGCTVQSYL